MATPKKTKRNPYGLTAKQSLVKDLMVVSAKAGEGLKPSEAHKKVYSTKNSAVASSMAYENLNKPDFRQALLDGLTGRKILGKNSKTEKRLSQGLDAVQTTSDGDKVTDYRTRLAYIQEINKVAGVYAPEKRETKRLNINLDLTTEELKKKNQQLQEELAT